MIMETKEYIRRQKQHAKEERAKHPHVWMIEVYTYCTDKKKWLWEIAGDSEGQYRIFGMRSGARYFMRGEFAYAEENRGKKLRVMKYVRA